MSLKTWLFGDEKKEDSPSKKDIIMELFDESAATGNIEGETIEALAAIYEHSPRSPSGQPVEMPTQQRLAQMFVDSHKQAGFISPRLLLSPNAAIEMRELQQGESKEIKSLNDCLALMLAEQSSEADFSKYKAISLSGDPPVFGMVWFAIVVK